RRHRPERGRALRYRPGADPGGAPPRPRRGGALGGGGGVMTKIQSETEIAAPREDVFDLLIDPSRLDDWVTASRGVSDVSDEPLTNGSSFRQTLRVGGAPFHVRWKVVELERPSIVVWEGKGPAGAKAKVTYELAPNGAGT